MYKPGLSLNAWLLCLCAGFFPTLLEDVPDMAVKFAAYESMRQLHKKLNDGRSASPQVCGAMALGGAAEEGLQCTGRQAHKQTARLLWLLLSKRTLSSLQAHSLALCLCASMCMVWMAGTQMTSGAGGADQEGLSRTFAERISGLLLLLLMPPASLGGLCHGRVGWRAGSRRHHTP
jgi:hypothetical protein